MVNQAFNVGKYYVVAASVHPGVGTFDVVIYGQWNSLLITQGVHGKTVFGIDTRVEMGIGQGDEIIPAGYAAVT